MHTEEMLIATSATQCTGEILGATSAIQYTGEILIAAAIQYRV
jgi:hypothetical protein